jgi:glycerate 2-kinase
VLRATMQPGIDVIIDRIELDRHLQGARALVTGEGSLDRQSLRGKAAVGVCRCASAFGIPTFRRRGRVCADRCRSARGGLRRRLHARRSGAGP